MGENSGAKLCHTRDGGRKIPIYENRVAFFFQGVVQPHYPVRAIASHSLLISKGNC